jgi:membrane-bound inhibitor of C-type lysozyme
MSSRKLTRSIIIGAVAIAVAGGSYGIVSATSSSPATSSSGFAHAPGSGGGSNARSGPAAGGAAGTVASLSSSGFTLTTSAGQKVTIKEAPTTTYQKQTSPASANAITAGEPVLVLGTTNNTTITAAQVIVEPAGSAYTASSAKVIPFQQGAPSTSKQAGQIPANYTEGSGTIVGGTTANKATKAALAAYPGGVVDRVVKLSNGEYEVHNIGVNWPHHVFVNQNFKVVGAE